MNISLKKVICGISSLLLLSLTLSASAAVYPVTNSADAGPGSLRQAILDANNLTPNQQDVIDFVIPNTDPNCVDVDGLGNYVCSIRPGSQLPAIRDSVIMDGSIAETRVLPGNPTKRPGIEIDMSTAFPKFGAIIPAPLFPNALTLWGPDASNSDIRGLVLNGLNPEFVQFCILSFNNSDPMVFGLLDAGHCGFAIQVFAANHVVIAGNYIHFEVDGITPDTNGLGTTAIFVADSSHVIIGGNKANDRNVMTSVRSDRPPLATEILRLALVGWSSPAFGAPKALNNNRIMGNYLGLTAEGSALNPRIRPILIDSTNNPDAPLLPAPLGLIGFGVQCDDQINDPCEITGNVIEANVINNVGSSCINIFNYAENTVIKDNNAFSTEDPLVNGPFAYVEMINLLDVNGTDGPDPKVPVNTTISGNQFGVDQNGDPVGSALIGMTIIAGEGILIKENLVRSTILNNINIRDNRFLGYIYFPNNVTISENSLYDSGLANDIDGVDCFLAIDLNPGPPFDPNCVAREGVTPNDFMDPDGSVNGLQNYPVLTQISFNPAVAFLEGTLNSEPKSLYVIEFFSNDKLHPSGHGEGKSYLTRRVVSTDKNGDVAFSVPYNEIHGEFLTDENNKTYITATATLKKCEDGTADCNLGSTSEFSKACEVDMSDLAKHDVVICN